MAQLGRTAALLAASVMLSSVSGRAALRNDIEYARAGDMSLRMDANLPDSKTPAPAVIIVHGGGWIAGDRKLNVAPLFNPLSEAGFAWFSISYRLATDFLRFGEAVDDVGAAIKHIRANASAYNVDPNRIALIGESAGAHLASLAAMRDPQAVAGVVALYAPSDLESLARTSRSIPEAVRQAVTSSGFGDLLLGMLRQYSPINHVRQGLPPFLLIHGTEDTLVPYEQSIRLQERMKSAGVPCDLVTVRGGGHGLRGWDRTNGMASYRSDLIKWLRETLGQSRASAA